MLVLFNSAAVFSKNIKLLMGFVKVNLLFEVRRREIKLLFLFSSLREIPLNLGEGA